MGNLNRFEPLKGYEGAGFGQVAKVKDYKRLSRAGSELIGAGLCSAMTMHWLQSSSIPTADKDFAELAVSQESYEKLAGETDSLDVATHVLAHEFDLAVEDFWPVFAHVGSDGAALRRAREHWEQYGMLGNALSRYINGELTPNAPKFPLLIGVYIAVRVKPKDGVLYEDGDIEDAEEDYSGEHVFALKRFMRATGDVYYQFFDPNAGVYEIQDGRVESFFNTLVTCYEDLNLRASNDPEFPWKVKSDLTLTTIYSMVPRPS